MNSDIRERAREMLRVELAEAMSTLFSERGFDEVTVDEAARVAGISRATFFRYFGSKEEAVLVAFEATMVDFAAILEALPATEGDTPWTLLHRAFAEGFTADEADAERIRARLRMINATPPLRARLLHRRLAREESLAAALAPRLRRPEHARVLASAAFTAVDLARRAWADGDQASLLGALERAFAGLGEGADHGALTR